MGLCVAAGLLLIFGGLKYLGFIWPSEGPLGGAAGNEASAKTSHSANTAMFFVPENTTDSTFVLQGVEPIGVAEDELTVLGAGVLHHCGGDLSSNCVDSFSAPSWPPRGTDPEPIEGFVMEPGDEIRVVLGLRFVPAKMHGWLEQGEGRFNSMSVQGVALRYREGVRRYRTELGPAAEFNIRVQNNKPKPIHVQEALRQQRRSRNG